MRGELQDSSRSWREERAGSQSCFLRVSGKSCYNSEVPSGRPVFSHFASAWGPARISYSMKPWLCHLKGESLDPVISPHGLSCPLREGDGKGQPAESRVLWRPRQIGTHMSTCGRIQRSGHPWGCFGQMASIVLIYKMGELGWTNFFVPQQNAFFKQNLAHKPNMEIREQSSLLS